MPKLLCKQWLVLSSLEAQDWMIAPEIQSFQISLSFSPLLNVFKVWDWIAQGKVSIEMLKVSVEDSPTGTIIERMGEAYNEARDLARAANICRFPLAVIQGVTDAIGAHRVGIRLSPYNYFQDTKDSHPNGHCIPIQQCHLMSLSMVISIPRQVMKRKAIYKPPQKLKCPP